MSKRKTKKSLNVLPWIVGGAIGLGGLAFYVTASGAKVPVDLQQVASLAPSTTVSQKVHVVQPHAEGMKVTYSSSEKEAPTDQDPKVFAVNEYLHQIPAVDKNAHVLAINVKNGVANLSMSKEFGLSYGMEDEKLILDGIANTLGSMEGIDKFILSMDGQPIDTLGHADLTEPMPVIRKGEASKPSEESTPSRPR